LRAFGVSTIIVSELSPARAAHAKEAGADHVLDPRKDDVPEFCRKTCNGRGVHIVIECAGVQPAMDAAIESVRGKGMIVGIAIFEEDIRFNPNAYNRKSVTYKGSNIYTREEFQEVIDAIASGNSPLKPLSQIYFVTISTDTFVLPGLGKIKNPEKMITAKVPLEDAVKGGFEALIVGKDRHVKILIYTGSEKP
jgi:threonine dehydrogenase-like Zn-dependent dehydrogenase